MINFQDQEIIIFLIFFLPWILAYIIGKRLNLGKYGVTIKPFLLMVKTEKVVKILDFLSKKLNKVLPVITNISIVLAFGMMTLGGYTLSKNLYLFIYKAEEAYPVFPAIPVITIRESLPYFLISAAIIIIVHEFAHGIVARYEKIRIKSAGFLLVALIFGGFIEPEEEDFNKVSLEKKLKVLSAGSSANIIFGLIIVVLLATLIQPTGVVVNVIEGYPAAEAGLQTGDVIIAVNGTRVSNTEEFRSFMSKVGVNNTLILDVKLQNSSCRSIIVKTVGSPEKPEKPIIGVYVSDYIEITPTFLTLFWTQFWSINIAVVNMIPIYPLDGGNILDCLAKRFIKKEGRVKLVRTIFSSIFVSLLALNIILTFIKFGFITI